MEKTDKVTKIISVFLFAALLCYLGVYLIRSVTDPVRTAMAVTVTVRESATLSGIVIRNEQVITSDAAYIDVTAQEGKRISAGETLAVSYDSESALERANRIRELELEIRRGEALLSGLNTAEDLTTRDSAVRSAVLGLSAAVARGDLSQLDSSSLSLRSLVFDSDSAAITEQELYDLKFELNGLYASSTSDTVAHYASGSGIYSSILDGYEHLTPGGLDAMSPSQLQACMQDRQEPAAGAIGKLISSSTWYYAAIADTDTVWEENGNCLLKLGGRAYLEFGRYYNTDITAEVVSVSRDVDGQCVVVFACSEALADTLAMRQVSAEVIYAEHTGIRVPTEAIHRDEDGTAYVYTMTGIQAERKNIEISYEGSDFCLVEPSGDADTLRDGNDIIISGKDLYDGKVME